jgi:hypothetical protein
MGEFGVTYIIEFSHILESRPGVGLTDLGAGIGKVACGCPIQTSSDSCSNTDVKIKIKNMDTGQKHGCVLRRLTMARLDPVISSIVIVFHVVELESSPTQPIRQVEPSLKASPGPGSLASKSACDTRTLEARTVMKTMDATMTCGGGIRRPNAFYYNLDSRL